MSVKLERSQRANTSNGQTDTNESEDTVALTFDGLRLFCRTESALQDNFHQLGNGTELRLRLVSTSDAGKDDGTRELTLDASPMVTAEKGNQSYSGYVGEVPGSFGVGRDCRSSEAAVLRRLAREGRLGESNADRSRDEVIRSGRPRSSPDGRFRCCVSLSSLLRFQGALPSPATSCDASAGSGGGSSGHSPAGGRRHC